MPYFSALDYSMLVITAMLGVTGLISILRNAESGINLAVVFSSFLFLYLGAGACFTLLFADPAEIERLAKLYEVGQQDLARACAFILLFGFTLCFFGRLCRRQVVLSSEEMRSFASRGIELRVFYGFLLACALLELYVVKSDRLGFEGVLLDTSAGEIGMASPWALLANWVSISLAPACIFIMAARQRIKWVLVLGFLWNAGLVSIVSRRNFLSMVFVSLLPLFVFPYSRRFRLGVLAGSLAVGGLAVVLFFGFRLAMWEKAVERTEVGTIVSGGINMFADSKKVELAKDRLLENVTTRTFNICYASLIAEYAFVAGGANGVVLEYSVMSIVPAFLYPDKPYFSYIGGEEGVAMKTFRIETSIDENNSVVTAALTDFGYVGVPIYAFILFLVIAVSLRVIRWTKGAALGLVAFCFLVFTMTDIENPFAAMFLSFRLIATLCAIAVVLNAVISPKPIHRSHK